MNKSNKFIKKDWKFLLTIKEILKSFGDSRTIIKKYIIENKLKKEYKNNFINDIQKIIKTDRTYVGEIEVLNFIKIIEKSYIKVYTNKNIIADNSLNLILKCEHWEYI